MIIDVSVALLILLLAWLGFRRGLFSQAWGLGALAVAYLGTPPAIELCRALTGWPGAPETVYGGFLLNLGAGFAVYLILTLLGRLIEVILIEQLGLISAGNKVLGGVLGLVKGAILAGLALWTVQFGASYVMDDEPALTAQLASSVLVQQLGGLNPLNFIYLHRLTPYLPDPGDGKPRPLPTTVATPELDALVADAAFAEAVQARDYQAMLTNPHWRAVMSDPRVSRRLNALR